MAEFIELSDEEMSKTRGGYASSTPVFDGHACDINPEIRLKKRFPWIFR